MAVLGFLLAWPILQVALHETVRPGTGPAQTLALQGGTWACAPFDRCRAWSRHRETRTLGAFRTAHGLVTDLKVGPALTGASHPRRILSLLVGAEGLEPPSSAL